MKKKIVSMMLVLGMLASALAGCGQGETASTGESSTPADKSSEVSGESTKSESTEAVEEDDGIFNATGYPIVDEEITLTIGVAEITGGGVGKYEDLNWTKYVEELSGINLEFVYYSSETAGLMFADADYPDIMVTPQSSQQIYDAALVGDVLPLNDLIAEYAPTWNEYLENNELTRKMITFGDGNIYSLPLIREEPNNSALRDQLLINKKWLDELGLEIPTTTDELYDVLVAFRDNAGKGSIPEDVIPFYPYGITNNVGGASDFFGFFGMYVTPNGGSYFLTVDDNQKVQFNWSNEGIKEPLEYLHKLVEEDLIPEESFTDDWAAYSAKNTLPAAESNIGVRSSYQNYDLDMTTYVAFGPLDSGNGSVPLMRSQVNSVTLNRWTIFKNCEYPEAAIRLADLMADPELSLQANYGMEADGYTKKNADGTWSVINATDLPNYRANSVPGNALLYLMPEEFFDNNNVTYEEGANQYTRFVAVNEVYKGKTIDPENLYPPITFTDKNIERASQLYGEIIPYMSATITEFVMNGNIEEGWDAYIAELEKRGLEEFLAIAQEELDAFNAR